MRKSLWITYACVYLFGVVAHAQEEGMTGAWKCEFTFTDAMGPFTVPIYFKSENQESFTAHSSEKGLKRAVGGTKYALGRLFGKIPKKGCIINWREGRSWRTGALDSLTSKISLPMVGKIEFNGIRTGDKLSGILIKEGESIGTVEGTLIARPVDLGLRSIVQEVFDTTYAHIYNPGELEHRKWRKFQRKVLRFADKAKDDVELFLKFNMLAGKLHFSHYNLFVFPQAPNPVNEGRTETIELVEKSDQTVYMNVKSFSGSAYEMDSIFQLILSKSYENLIVDLRFNPGGDIDSAIPFGEFLSDSALDAGVFLSNRWFTENKEPPGVEEYGQLPVTRARAIKDFLSELRSSQGRRVVVGPGTECFDGQVFVLTSNKTASTCEPTVYALKHYGLATIVGEQTAGSILSAVPIQARGKYYARVPIADYYTVDGIRLDQVGVAPDIEVEADQALDYVLEHLIK